MEYIPAAQKIVAKIEAIDKEVNDLYDLLDHARYIGNYRLAASLSACIDRLDSRSMQLEDKIGAYAAFWACR